MKKQFNKLKNFIIKIENKIYKKPRKQRLLIGFGLIFYALVAYVVPLLPATIPLLIGIRVLSKEFKKK